MRRLIAKLIYPEYEKWIIEKQKRIRQLDEEKNLLERELSEYRELMERFKKTVEEKKSGQNIELHFVRNKPILVHKIIGDGFIDETIIMYSTKISNQPAFTINANIKRSDSGQILTIDDITGEEVNNGFGSVFLKDLIDFARIKKVSKIKGELYYEDIKDHKDRLIHFYEKFGFKVSFFKNKDNLEEGKIELILNN